jgi:hypothetical protein
MLRWRRRTVVHLGRWVLATSVRRRPLPVLVHLWSFAEPIERILVAHVHVWWWLRSLDGASTFKGRVVAAWFIGIWPVAMASVRTICVYGVARLL